MARAEEMLSLRGPGDSLRSLLTEPPAGRDLHQHFLWRILLFGVSIIIVCRCSCREVECVCRQAAGRLPIVLTVLDMPESSMTQQALGTVTRV